MWLTRISVQNPVFAAMMMFALMVLGLFAYKDVGVFLEEKQSVTSARQYILELGKTINALRIALLS